ncbi:MAG: type II toxin-antitoxin system RelE/ParE family toxin [Candidatus Omnitrophica bacterium]|nr:type II toxin-antitoxin system RelE/ParE family toxin [Candidatus Omnitrophota bacterium]
MSSYHVDIDPAARRDLKKFKRNFSLLRIFISLIDGLATSPFEGKPLAGDKKGCYSLRHQDYRIIYTIYPESKTVLVISIGHRWEVYR